jgi:hypothetical protein
VISALTVPPYGTGTLADVLPAAASLLKVAGFEGAILPDPDADPAAVTVLLIDGLGWWPWQAHAELTPTLAALSARRLSSTIPSTTPTALASLGTGLPPGAHGIVGAAFRLPEDDRILHPLSWATDPHPIAVQPERTVFERVATAGLPVVSIGASAYGTSGLTRAVLRGGDYIGIDDPGDMVAVLSRHRRGLAYAYLPDLDRLGHVHGTDSAEWRTCLRDVDDMVARILDQIGDDHQLIVTADHGMVDCPSSGRVEMEDLPMSDDIVAIAGEPRLRYAYCRSGSATRVLDAWRDVLAEVAWVLSREEVVASGLMGEMEPDYAERLGDVVVIARGNTVLASSVDPIVSGLIGQHGAVTDAEMDIPLLQGGGHGHG